MTGHRCADSHKLCCKAGALKLMAINSLGDEVFLVMDGKVVTFANPAVRLTQLASQRCSTHCSPVLLTLYCKTRRCEY